jgi:hypothetical protein
MEGEYLDETFSSESGEFDQKFTDFLNSKGGDNWKVKSCTYCHDAVGARTVASCIFKRKH